MARMYNEVKLNRNEYILTHLSRNPHISSLIRIPTPIYISYFEIGYLVTRLSRYVDLGPSTDEINV